MNPSKTFQKGYHLSFTSYSKKKLQRETFLNPFHKANTTLIPSPKITVQFSHSVVSDSLKPHARQASVPINSWSLPKLMSIESVKSSNHLILCHSLLLSMNQLLFPHELALCIRWPKFWSFSFSISPSNEYSESALQGTLKSLLQHHNSKASILWRSAFFMVQLSHPYMTTGKTIALTRWTFVDKVMSLLFNMLSRFVTAFPPKSKHL